jgi:hypothetical protein
VGRDTSNRVPKGANAAFAPSRAPWLGLGYAFSATRVTFEAPAGTPGLPVGGFTPSFTYESRDNMFALLRGTFHEALVGVFDPAPGADDESARASRRDTGRSGAHGPDRHCLSSHWEVEPVTR